MTLLPISDGVDIPCEKKWSKDYAAIEALPQSHYIRIAIPNRKAWLKIRALKMAMEQDFIRTGVVSLLRKAKQALEGREMAALLGRKPQSVDYHLRSFDAVVKRVEFSLRYDGVFPHHFRRMVSFYELAPKPAVPVVGE
jgi:hypothetical protein